MDMTPETIAASIGLAGAPFLAVMVVDHLKQFVRAVERAVLSIRAGYAMPESSTATPGGSPWPLVRDLVTIGAAFLIRESGGLRQVFDAGVQDNPATLILVGLALSYLAGQVHDRGLLPGRPGTQQTD